MKLLFFDIDGTLCMPGTPPSQAVVEAIRVCRNNGHKVFLCTGRLEHTVAEAVRAIGFDGGIYSAGGRVIVEEKELHHQTMSLELVKTIQEVMEERNINFTFESEDCLFEGGRIFENEVDGKHGSSELKRVIELRKTLGARYPVDTYKGEPVYKITYMASSEEEIAHLHRKLDGKAKVVRFDNLLEGTPVIAGEVSDPSINKGIALERICHYYHAKVEDCIAFGDSMNDAEVLLAAGTGIAMGDSCQEIKDLADRICEDCEKDGVAHELHRLGLTS